MNPQPVKVETFDEFPYRMVEWKLHDKCNYNCPFCGDENKLGHQGWADLETNKEIVDSIVAACQGKPFWIQLTGGEPTLYPKFKELVSYMKEKGAYTSVISNGSRTLRWWKEVRDLNVLDMVMLTFHSQQDASYKHLADVTNLFLDTETFVLILSTYTKDSVDYVLEGLDYLIENTASIITTNAMDIIPYRIDDTTVGKEKFDKLVNEYNIKKGKKFSEKKLSPIPFNLWPLKVDANITYDDGTVENKNVTQMMKLGENRFENWTCFAGLETMNIERGFKFRGGCKRDKTPYEPNNLSFFDKPFKCDVYDCYCANDMITTKIRNTD